MCVNIIMCVINIIFSFIIQNVHIKNIIICVINIIIFYYNPKYWYKKYYYLCCKHPWNS